MSSSVSLEPTQGEPAQNESVQIPPAQIEPVQIPPAEIEPVQIESVQIPPAQIEPVNVDPVHIEPVQIPPAQIEPVQIVSVQIPPAQIEPVTVDPVQIPPAQIEPVQIESVQIPPAQNEPVQIPPAQIDPVQIESVQIPPAQIEPVNVEPVQSAPTEPAVGSSEEKHQHDRVKLLEQELRNRTDERENYKNRMKQMEIEIATLQKKTGGNDGATNSKTSQKAQTDREENTKLRDMVVSLKETIREKTSCLSRKTLQIEALETQVAALKEVTMLSKGMLDIRNTENMKLKEQIDIMQHKITAERIRHNTMLKKTEQAASINDQLKDEYHKQVALFGELKERYERKVELLKEEIERLEALQVLTPS